jgi:glycerol-3-phosphate acyltransferase PlsY
VLPIIEWLTPGRVALDIGATRIASVILFRHRSNMARLLSHTERALPPSSNPLRRTSGT